MAVVVPFLIALLPTQPHIQAKPQLKNTVASFFVLPPAPKFPDFSANYQAMLTEKARVAAVEALQAQQQAAAVVVAPPVVYTAPTLSTNDYKTFIYAHESGNNPGAVNPYSGACGLGQALPCSKMPCSLADYACQDNFFTQYALERYGSWAAAYGFWLTHNYW